MTRSDPKPRAPLKPVPEGWRRYALAGAFALALLGIGVAIGALYAMAWLLPLTR